jgi:hypothetical protein
VCSALTIAAAHIAPARAASEVYIQQARGRVAPGSSVMTRPPPEITGQVNRPAAAPTTAPDTRNAQNAKYSQACYTATQQAKPASRQRPSKGQDEAFAPVPSPFPGSFVALVLHRVVDTDRIR